MPENKNQTTTMKWILFWVFVVLFAIIVILTLGSVFFGMGNPSENERSLLFKIFIGEIGLAVVALFYALFNLKQTVLTRSRRVRLDFSKYLRDINKFIAKTAICSPILYNGKAGDDIECTITDDNGPFISFDFPKNTKSIHVTVKTARKEYQGSFQVDTHRVNMQ